LKAAKAAGVTPGAWAREHGIDGRSLNAWRLNLAQGRETREVTRRRAPALVVDRSRESTLCEGIDDVALGPRDHRADAALEPVDGTDHRVPDAVSAPVGVSAES
jgi:hypothetical protein